MKHKFVNTTGGPSLKICCYCGKLKTECGAVCERPPTGLLTSVSKSGVEIYNLWKSLGFLSKSKTV